MSKAKAKGKKKNIAQKSVGKKWLIGVCFALLVLIIGIGTFIGFRVWQKPKAHEHVYTNGVCNICKELCAHEEYKDGVCTVCGIACVHEYEEGTHTCKICGGIGPHTYAEGTCTVCGEKCEHEKYENGMCAECGTACKHEYAEGSHECKICGYISAHTYAEGEHDCSICGKAVNHFYEAGGHKCVACGEVSAHEYEEGRHECKICGEVSAHEWEKGVCQICQEQCMHENENDVCKICGMSLAQFTVTFNTNGGPEIESVTVTDRFAVAQPDDPVWEDHRFDGWFTDESCTSAYDFDTEVSGNLTLYAKWITIIYFNVTLNLNGGEIILNGETSQESKVPVRVESGLLLQLGADPTRAGYEFKGWFTNSKCTTPFDAENPITKNINLYSLWSVQYLRVEYNPDEAPTNIRTTSVRYGQVAPEYSVTFEGHTFCGWYTREVADETTEPNEDQYIKHVEGVAYLCTKFDFKTPITKNLTLYARWHFYAEGSHVCQNCGEIGDHTFENSVCTVCGICEKHDYTEGVCTRCEAHELRYLGVTEINDFTAAYSEMLKASAKAGETVTYNFGDALTVKKADGVILKLTVTSVSAERFNSEQGYGEQIDMTQSENSWSFTVPAESGTINVMLNGTVEQILPEGYHTIAYDIDYSSLGATELGGYFFFKGPNYAKEGEIVMARIHWTTNEGGVGTMPTINRAEYAYESSGISSDRYTIVETYSIVLFFKVTGDAKIKIAIS